MTRYKHWARWFWGLLLGVGLVWGLYACSPNTVEVPPITVVATMLVTIRPTPAETTAPEPTSTPRPTEVSAAATPSQAGTLPPPTQLPSLTPAGTTPEPATTPGAKPTSTSQQHLIELEYPPQMKLGDSDLVRLALMPVAEGYVVTTEFEGHETVTQTVAVTPRTGYVLWGVGRLDAVGFELSPSSEQAQLVAAGQATVWRWVVLPQRAGQQRLALSLALRWVPEAGASPTVETTIYNKGFTIQVNAFLGLTAREAMMLGMAGLGVGLTFSLPWAAYTLRGPKPLRAQQVRPNAGLAIERAAGLELTPAETTLLQSLFHQYARVVLEADFRSGYSGARTLLVRPLRADGRADAYTIAKLGERAGLVEEFMNYERYVKDTLPPMTARIQAVPVTPTLGAGRNRAALRYTFIGAPGTLPRSLLQALREHPDPRWLEKLFATFGPNWWMQRRPYTFRLSQEYDRGLPAHYVLQPLAAGARVRQAHVLDGRATPAQSAYPVGEVVTLRHWQVVETRADGVSLSLRGTAQPGHAPLRARWLGPTLLEGAQAQVVATRPELLAELTQGFGPWAAPILAHLQMVENAMVSGTQATIHGDLHLENILVGPGGLVWLIDFAQTRDGHTLYDFAHLHTSLLAQVIGPLYATDAEFLAHWASHPLSVTLRGLVAQCLFNQAVPREYDLALFMACLTGLKYTNLDATAKRRLLGVAGRLELE